LIFAYILELSAAVCELSINVILGINLLVKHGLIKNQKRIASD